MNIKTILILSVFAILVSCKTDNSDFEFYPKPLSPQKIVFPEKVYKTYQARCDYSFDVPKYATIKLDTTTKNCNPNIILNGFNAELFLTHVKLDSNLMTNIEYSRKLAYEHSIKADGIEEAVIKNPENKVFGMQYKIIGNSASNYQFYVTDSTDHFLRGALYFNAKPNYDSLKPFLEFIIEDFDHLIKTIDWK